jgi:hypothetical protein
MLKTDPIQESHTHTHIYDMFPKVGLLEEIKGRGKEGRK